MAFANEGKSYDNLLTDLIYPFTRFLSIFLIHQVTSITDGGNREVPRVSSRQHLRFFGGQSQVQVIMKPTTVTTAATAIILIFTMRAKIMTHNYGDDEYNRNDNDGKDWQH